MSGGLHACQHTSSPVGAITGSKQNASPTVVEADAPRCSRRAVGRRHEPDLGLVDGGDEEPPKVRRTRPPARCTRSNDVESCRGAPTRRWIHSSPSTPRTPHRAVGQPVEASTAEPASRPWIGRRGEHPFRAAADGDDRDRRTVTPSLDERHRSSIGRQSGLGQLSPRRAPVRSGSAAGDGEGRHGPDYGAIGRETRLIGLGRTTAHCPLPRKEAHDEEHNEAGLAPRCRPLFVPL